MIPNHDQQTLSKKLKEGENELNGIEVEEFISNISNQNNYTKSRERGRIIFNGIIKKLNNYSENKQLSFLITSLLNEVETNLNNEELTLYFSSLASANNEITIKNFNADLKSLSLRLPFPPLFL